MRSNSIWRRIWAQPPIDLKLLIAERSRGQRHTLASIAKIKVGRARALKARQLEASKRHQARRKAQRRPRCRNVIAMFLGAMEPGGCYARADIRDMSGLPYGSACALSLRYVAAGWLQRLQNADWAPGLENKGVPIWLFMLTAAGEAKRNELLESITGQTRQTADGRSPKR